MGRWFLTLFLLVIVLASTLPWLERMGLGRLPGDLRLTLFGRVLRLPFASTILLSLAALLLARVLK